MSAEKPEAGDVWTIIKSEDEPTKKIKIFIIEETFINDEFRCLCSQNGNFWTTDIAIDYFSQPTVAYFGKSKANINDLFEVTAQCTIYDKLHDEYYAFGSQQDDFPAGAYVNRITGKFLTREDWNNLKYRK